MRVAIRADASTIMGTGHVRRCLSLAEALRQAGAHVEFITRVLGTDAPAKIQVAGFPVHLLPAPTGTVQESTPPHADWAGVPWQQDAEETIRALRKADWVVVDHYAFDARWHKAVAPKLGARLAIIDDLADRPLHGDVLIDQNLADFDHGEKYKHRLGTGLTILGGPHYALLGPAYLRAPRCQVTDEVRSIGIFMGGTDPAALSEIALRACREVAGFTGPIEVVTTQANPRHPELRALAQRWPQTSVVADIPELSGFFSRHGLQIGAGGSATWERCCVGAPTIALVGSRNQLAVVPQLAKAGAVATLDSKNAPTPQSLGALVRELLNDTARRRALATRARELVDGRGAQRVALRITANTLRVRKAEREDSDLMYRWRNDPVTRIVSRNPEEIGPKQHAVWLQRTLADKERLLLIGEVGAIRAGVIRFDRLEGNEVQISVYVDPELHGLGLGEALVKAGEEAALAWAGKGLTLVARVLGGNTRARRAFEAAGYAFKGEAGRKKA